MNSNRKVDALIFGGEFLIDLDFGYQALLKYLHDLSLVESGVSVKDLGYSNDPKAAISIIDSDNRISDYKNGASKGSIAKIGLTGVMQMEGGMSRSGIRQLAEQIQDLDSNPNIVGFKFDVNSGGGEATAGIHLYNTIKDLKKPSVAQVHTMASAAYLAMLPVKEMIALSSMSRIGSIGALISIDKEFIKWYQENVEDIYSSKSPEKNDEIRSYLFSGDTSKLVKSLDTLVDEFHAKVVMHRELNPDYKEETLKGRTFYSKDARKRGLIDAIGTEDFATKRLNHYIKNSYK